MGFCELFNNFGDPVQMPVRTPEIYTQITFKWQSVPNRETGVQTRVNVGPDGAGTLIYTLPWSVEAASKLYNMREDDIQFLVKIEGQKTIQVLKQNNTLEQNWKLFTENSFEYLNAADYLSTEQKL